MQMQNEEQKLHKFNMQLAYSNASLFSAVEKKVEKFKQISRKLWNWWTQNLRRRWYENDCAVHLI